MRVFTPDGVVYFVSFMASVVKTYNCSFRTSLWSRNNSIRIYRNICTDCTGSCQSNYHTTMTTTATLLLRVSDNINSLNMYIDKTQLCNLLCSFQIHVYRHNTHFCSSNISCPNNVHGEVYSIQQYVIKFVSDLRQIGGFLRVLRCRYFPANYKR
jgi:hypothetical protein